jgi:hypothetical protein
MKFLLSLLMAVLSAAALRAEPARRLVVVPKGDQQILSTGGSIISVSTPPGSPTGIVHYGFQQYSQTITLDALKPGEVKLLVEYTDSSIGDIIDVIVTERKTFDLWRSTVAQLAGLPGLDEGSILPAGNHIVVTGTLYSAADVSRCLALQTASPKAVPDVICATRMSSVATVVYPDAGSLPLANIELTQSAPPIASETTHGLEGLAKWTLTVRFGDIPALVISSMNRDDLLFRAAVFAWRVNHAASDWRQHISGAATPYPTTFQGIRAGSKWNIGMIWRFDQGTHGEPLIQLTPSDVADIAGSAGGADRAVGWSAAILQDAFRMYEMAQRPTRTISEGSAPLVKLYEAALGMAPSLDRTSAPVALARAWYSLQLVAGQDPVASLPSRPPATFNAAAAGVP